MFGIGEKAVERIRLCAKAPVPHLCIGGRYCPYTRLIRHGLVEHVGNGLYSATEKGRMFIKQADRA